MTSITKLSLLNGITKMLTNLTSFFLGVHFVNIGFSGAQIGLIMMAGTITSIITVLPSGLGSDKIKAKSLIAIALTALSLQFFTFSLTNNFAIMIMAFFIGGIGTTMYNTATDSLFHKETEKKEISKKIAMYHSLNYIFMAVGIFSAGRILDLNISFEQIFLGLSIGLLIIAIFGQLILPENAPTKFEILHYKKDIFKPKVLTFLLILFLFSIHFGSENTTYGLFLKNVLNLKEAEMGLYMGAAIISMGATAWIISKNVQKWKAQYVLIAGLILSGAGQILMTINQPVTSFLFRALHETGDAGVMFFIYYGINKLFDLDRIGGNASIFLFVSTIGSALGAIVFGPLGEAYSYNLPIIISGITILFASTISIKFLHHFEHE